MDKTDKEYRLKDMVCPQCKKEFLLRWEDCDNNYKPVKETLIIRVCPSGGLYDVRIKCPHCNYEEEL